MTALVQGRHTCRPQMLFRLMAGSVGFTGEVYLALADRCMTTLVQGRRRHAPHSGVRRPLNQSHVHVARKINHT